MPSWWSLSDRRSYIWGNGLKKTYTGLTARWFNKLFYEHTKIERDHPKWSCLGVEKQFFIMVRPKGTTLNSRSEFYSTCRTNIFHFVIKYKYVAYVIHSYLEFCFIINHSFLVKPITIISCKLGDPERCHNQMNYIIFHKCFYIYWNSYDLRNMFKIFYHMFD